MNLLFIFIQNQKNMETRYSALSKHWQLDPSVTFLNHGSFGATPVKILKLQQKLRARLESEPVHFMIREMEPMWFEARKITAEFLGCKPQNLVFVKNATMGVNTVIHSLQIEKGDDVLMTNHEYGACANTLKWYAAKNGWNVRIADVPYPLSSEDDVVEAVMKAVTPRTKFALIDHITSATGTIFPVEKIVPLLKEKGIEVMIDGAHAPGMIDLNIENTGADYYTGNCHKWICSPKGSAILYVSDEKKSKIQPLQVSHTYDKPVTEEEKWAGTFFWPGTDDYTAFLCVPAAIEFMGSVYKGGWNELRSRNRSLALNARKIIAEVLETDLPVPENMIGSLANICLGKSPLPPYGFNYTHPLQEKLFTRFKIEVPVMLFSKDDPRLWIRVAAQAYNDISQYEYLAQALVTEWKK